MASDEEKGWKPIVGVTGNDDSARGLIQPVTGIEQRPCLACRSFEKNDQRLRQLIESKKDLRIDADGTVHHVAEMDIGDRRQTFNLRDFGWCRLQMMPVDQLATCPSWSPTKTQSDMIRKLVR